MVTLTEIKLTTLETWQCKAV